MTIDINEAVSALQGLALTLTDEVNGKKAQVDAIKLATSVLQSQVDLQNTELDKAKAALVVANDRIAVLEAAATPADPIA